MLLFTVAGCRSAAERQLSAAVDDYNRGCPPRMSELVRIDSLHYDRTVRDVAFYCTVNGLSNNALNNSEAMTTVTDYCSSEARRSFQSLENNDYGRETLMLVKRAGATLSFIFFTESGDRLAKFSQSDF